MISQLMDGLKTCGILEAIQKYPDQLRPLFCVDCAKYSIDEDTFLDLFTANYSLEQQKKILEIDTYKVFCDFVGLVAHKGL